MLCQGHCFPGGRVHIDKVCKCGAIVTNFLVEEFILIRCVSVVPGTLISWWKSSC